MGRPEYDDATAGDNSPQNTSGDTTGWLQLGQSTDDFETR